MTPMAQFQQESKPGEQSPRTASAVAPRPLMPISAVMWRLDVQEDQVLELIEEGRLAYAFNIALDRSRARALRILTESVSDYLKGRVRPADDTPEEFERVARQILPGNPVILGTDLCRALNCGSTHVMNLTARGAFQTVPGTKWGTGPGGSPRLERGSVLTWLKERRVA
jgi:hypothetical protein